MFLFNQKNPSPDELIKAVLEDIIEKSSFKLSFQLESKEEGFDIDIFGEDEGLLKAKNGKLLQALQTLLARVLRRAFPDKEYKLVVDSNGFWEEKEERLLSLVEGLVKKALDTNTPQVLKKPLSPNERRLIHEKVSGNTGVRSLSLGDGIYKTMKLIPDTYRDSSE